MRTVKKIWIKIAIFLLITGFTTFFVSLVLMKFDLTQLNTVDYVTNTHTVSEEFSNITVFAVECDVNFELANDGVCKVVCEEGERITHSVKVEDNRLIIERLDNRRWYENIGISWGKIAITVYLPDYSYNSLVVSGFSGNVDISKDFAFNSVEINTTSGEINFGARVNQKLKLISNSGNITVQPLITADVEIKSSSSNIELNKIRCDNLNLNGGSGEINLNQVLVNDDMQIKSNSGDINLEYCDAKTVYLQSNSGDINGIMLTKKIFDVTTKSGDIDVPNSDSGEKCRIVTESGDVEMQVKAVCWVG